MSARGQKTGFTVEQIACLRERLQLARDFRGAALLNFAVDSMLRAGDIVSLTVADVLDKTQITVKQGKTRSNVSCQLLPHTLEAVRAYVVAARLQPEDLLFPMCERTLSVIVKVWARGLGLEPKHYAAHSLRRTKAAVLAEGCSARDLDKIRVLLGHRWITSTQAYLGVNRDQALEFARSRIV